MTTILDARPIREKYIVQLKEDYKKFRSQGIIPSMSVLLIGDNPTSIIYTRNKKKFIENLGGQCNIISLPKDTTEKELCSQLMQIASDDSIHGCFVQLPLPQSLSHLDVGQMIPSKKDIDGFHKENLYSLMNDRYKK